MGILRTAKGLMLTEILIAVVVFGIGVIGSTALTTMATNSSSSTKRRAIAIVLAQDRMESALQLGFVNLNNAAGSKAYNSIAGYPAYRRVTTVTNDTPDQDMKTIAVQVFWDADVRSVTARTILSK